MPMIWTEPEVAVEHNGVTVYHTYKDGEYRSQYWYTLDESADDWECAEAFDIRELQAYTDVDGDDAAAILKAAIESGELDHAPDCSRDCDVVPGGRFACATPISEV